MSTCKKCGIKIRDNTVECPLCHCVLDGTTGQASNGAITGSDTSNEGRAPGGTEAGMYPNIAATVRKFRFVERLVLFLSIVSMMGLVLANIIGRPFVAWTVIIGLILIYVNTALRMGVTGRVGYWSKTIFLTFLAVAVLIGIDALTGYYRWSINVILPSAVLFLNFSIFLLIFINMRNWQSYISMEILQVFLCAVMLILYMVGVITYPNIVYIATAVSLLLFTGTVIFGGDRARRELYRRFHI